MKRQGMVLCSLFVALGLGLVMAQDPKATRTPSNTEGANQAPPQTDAKESADLSAIRAVANSFLDAYRAEDPAALGALFTENAEIVDDDGEITSGRPDIVERFTRVFKAKEGGTLNVDVDSIRLLSPELAIEEGTATVSDEGEKPESNRYTIIYVKRDGRWLHARIEDQTPSEPDAHERLEDLEWMLGEWVNESDDELVTTTCTWADNGSFLIRQFNVEIEGKVSLSGTQRIGWDPLRKQFRTWVFDSKGGFAEGLITRDEDDENQWIIKSTGVRSDGQTVTATSIFTPLDKDRIAWETVGRTIGSVELPGLDRYTLVRKPPNPAR